MSGAELSGGDLSSQSKRGRVVKGRVDKVPGPNVLLSARPVTISVAHQVVASNRLTQNPDLVGLTSFKIFEKVVDALSKAGLLIILNNHVSWLFE